MSFYRDIIEFMPYFHSIRRTEGYLSIDMSFPDSWKLLSKYINKDLFATHPKQNDGETLISFFTPVDEGEVNKLISNIRSIIKYNLEREEKENLYKSKIEELRIVFDKNNLATLKGLTFNLSNKLSKLNESENLITELAQEGDIEG
jgi:hypothetical protein